MFVVGTAGHVDHGKSTLLEAITGIDPDRLKVEKERGMTVDLGFAWLKLPDGNVVSVVDVPGHEKFVNNMLAGVGGVDLALVIVAADESVMPQTREHLAILDILQVTTGMVVITKSDLVEPDWIDLVKTDVEDLTHGTVLQGAPVCTVSALTGDGLKELVDEIGMILRETPEKRDVGRGRLPIDRAFTMSGFGTVVTGTLLDGFLETGDEAELVLAGKSTRIRNLQTHRQNLEKAAPGTRVAVNLAGLSQKDIVRGDVLTRPGWLTSTTAVDVSLKVLTDIPKPLKHNMFVTVHTGSNETIAKLRLLESNNRADPGTTCWAQLKLESPIAVVKGDYFVIRSNQTTLGGGNVVEIDVKRHRRGHAQTLDRLSMMEQGSDRNLILATIQADEPSEFGDIVNRANLSGELAKNELNQMAVDQLIVLVNDTLTHGSLIYTTNGWTEVLDNAVNYLNLYHKKYPLRRGAPKEELRNRLGMKISLFTNVLNKLCDAHIVSDDGSLIMAFGYEPQLSEEERSVGMAYIEALENTPYSPPTDHAIDPDLLGVLVFEGKVVKVSDNVVFTASAFIDMTDKIKLWLKENGEITVADVRDMFGTSRKYALALMDYLDQERVTRRVGDSRVLR
ncbi:MAG: selenocysteine-specific translation elongation factor [Chloroflexota bacterium]|nr:selenocysteine-specific translation elongation factor [Chloroflexota bacterium]